MSTQPTSAGNAGELTNQVVVYMKKKRRYEYVGTTDARGMPEGRGELKYPDMSVYEGEFRKGKRSGFGTYHFSLEEGGFAHGLWKDGAPDENWKFWKIQYGNGDVYFGSIRMDTKARRDGEMLTVDMFMKHGEGEIYYAQHNVKYFGTFESNQRNGYGIMIFRNGDRYYGGFKEDRYCELGTYIYKDGSTFHGRWKDGKKFGRGLMLLSNGDRIEGRWNGETLDSAVFTKGNCSDCSHSMLTLLLENINDALRLRDELMFSGEHNDAMSTESNKWLQYMEIYRPKWVRQQQDMLKRIKHRDGLHNAADFLESVQHFLSEKDGFLHKFVQFFQSSFMGSYHIASKTSDRKHGHPKYQLPFAIDDVRSFINFLVALLSAFYEEVFKLTNFSRYRDLLIETVSEWIHDRLYSTLFSIYEAQFEDEDLLLTQKISSLRSSSLASIGISELFTPVGYDVHAEFTRMDASTPYFTACKMLEELRNKTSPSQKIEVLSAVRESVMQEMRQHRKNQRMHELGERYTPKQAERDDNWQPGADDVSAPISFVWIHASILNHHAQFHYIDEWKLSDVELSPVQWMIGYYEGFLQFVLDLDPNLKRDGVLVSNYQIRKAVEESIDREVDRCKKDRELPPTFFWLPQLLMHIQITVGSGLTEVNRYEGSNEYSIVLPREMLAQTIVAHFDTVQNVINNIKDIGFTLELRPHNYDASTGSAPSSSSSPTSYSTKSRQDFDTNPPEHSAPPSLETHDVWAVFNVVYPSHIYADLSLSVSRFLQFGIKR